MARGYINMEIIGREAAKAAGLKTYFTGEPCKSGHMEPRTVSNKNCVQCQKRHAAKWHRNNLEACKISRKKRYDNNKEIELTRAKIYQHNNLDKWRANQHARRARKLQVGGRHTAEDIANLLRNQDGLCVCCKTDIRENYTVDHIIPISDTAHSSNDPWNLQLLCGSCNSSKKDEDPRTWAARGGLTLSVDVFAALA
jgi:5-methylcytosine-specific restriction endonuclease McrA